MNRDAKTSNTVGERPRNLDEALKGDAGRIRADFSPQLERRIAAALARVEPAAPSPAPRETLVRPWLAGSLAGIATAALVILLVARLDGSRPPPAATPESTVAEVAPDYVRLFREQVPLHAETAELTAPLEEELRDLKSDVDKVRKNVEHDLRMTF